MVSVQSWKLWRSRRIEDNKSAMLTENRLETDRASESSLGSAVMPSCVVRCCQTGWFDVIWLWPSSSNERVVAGHGWRWSRGHLRTVAKSLEIDLDHFPNVGGFYEIWYLLRRDFSTRLSSLGDYPVLRWELTLNEDGTSYFRWMKQIRWLNVLCNWTYWREVWIMKTDIFIFTARTTKMP